MANPNDTGTFKRRQTWDRELDNDGVSNADADFDYSRNLRDLGEGRCSDQSKPPTRDTTPPKVR